MSEGVNLPAAGWYADPSDESRIRYWDGAAWTDHIAVAQPATQSPVESSEEVTSESATINQIETEAVASANTPSDQSRTPREFTTRMLFVAIFVIAAITALGALITSN